MAAGVSIVGVLVLALIALLVVGGIAAVVALLANPKTRAAGVALMTIGLVVVFVVGLGMFALFWSYAGVRSREVRSRAAVRSRMEEIGRELERAREGLPETPAERPVEKPAETAPAPETQPDAEATADAEPGEKPEVKPPPDPDSAAKGEEPPVAEERPAWVDQPPGRVGAVFQIAIKTDPRPTREECESQLPQVLEAAVAAYAETELNQSPQVAQQVRLPTYFQNKIVNEKNRWPEPVQTSFGKWVQLHALLQIDQETQREIQTQCGKIEERIQQEQRAATVTSRLCYTAAGVASVLVLLSALFGCLKIDEATEGACRRRLFLAAVVAILAVAGAVVFALRIVPAHAIPTRPPAGLQAVPIEPTAHGVTEAPVPPPAEVRAVSRVGMLPVGLLVLGGMVGLVLVLVGKKTRVAGIIVLALTAVLAMAIVGGHYILVA